MWLNLGWIRYPLDRVLSENRVNRKDIALTPFSYFSCGRLHIFQPAAEKNNALSPTITVDGKNQHGDEQKR